MSASVIDKNGKEISIGDTVETKSGKRFKVMGFAPVSYSPVTSTVASKVTRVRKGKPTARVAAAQDQDTVIWGN